MMYGEERTDLKKQEKKKPRREKHKNKENLTRKSKVSHQFFFPPGHTIDFYQVNICIIVFVLYNRASPCRENKYMEKKYKST